MKKFSRREFMEAVATCTAKLSFPLVAGGAVSSCTTVGREVMSLLNWGVGRTQVPEGRGPMEQVVSNIRSRVAISNSENSVTENGKVNSSVVRNMIKEGIKALGETSHIEEGWSKILPSYKTGEIVAIKVNVYAISRTRIEVVCGIIDELIDIGIRPGDILVWDSNPVLGATWKKVGYMAPMEKRGINLRYTGDPKAGYDQEVVADILSADLRLPFTNILSQQCDHLINISILKHHTLCGMTGALKNYYGAIPLSDTLLKKGSFDASKREILRIVNKMHANNGNPQIAEVAGSPIIRQKARLYVGDALLSLYSGDHDGAPQWINGQILFSQDPVAMDYQGFKLVDKKRAEMKLSSIIHRAKYIQSAAEMGLGTNHPDQIELTKISM